jgi:hypothetical protein
LNFILCLTSSPWISRKPVKYIYNINIEKTVYIERKKGKNCLIQTFQIEVNHWLIRRAISIGRADWPLTKLVLTIYPAWNIFSTNGAGVCTALNYSRNSVGWANNKSELIDC